MFTASPHIPLIPVSAYGDTLLSHLGTYTAEVFPYAAAVTGLAIGVGLVRRWLGAVSVTHFADGSRSYHYGSDGDDDFDDALYVHDMREQQDGYRNRSWRKHMGSAW